MPLNEQLQSLQNHPTAQFMRISLQAAVPLWIMHLQDTTFEHRKERANECSQLVAEKGDILQFRSNKKGETANVFNRLAEGIACLAFAPGGVTFLGDHWEA